MNLDELPTCTRCALSLTRQRVVVGSGPTSSSLLVLGEAPGRTEDEGGEPFIGRSGRLLFELLGEIGVRRQDCFVTNVVKCRPPDNRTPRREELEACRPWLLKQFRQCDANVVLALGNTSAKAVFGFTDPMGAVHGKVFELGSSRGIATYHPAAALRGGPSVVDVMRADLLILQALLAAS